MKISNYLLFNFGLDKWQTMWGKARQWEVYRQRLNLCMEKRILFWNSRKIKVGRNWGSWFFCLLVIFIGFSLKFWVLVAIWWFLLECWKINIGYLNLLKIILIGFYVSGGARGLVPVWAWASWVLVVVMAIGVSIMWISNLWVQFFRERRGKLEEKIR